MIHTLASPLGHALAFARHGHAVLPLTWPIRRDGRTICSCGKGTCRSPAKHPWGRLAPRGLLSATTDEAVIRRWYDEAPDANLGVVTTKLIALDIDPRHDGDDSLRALEQEYGGLPDTWQVLTGGGGLHIIFSAPPGLVVASSAAQTNPVLGAGIDVRGLDGYIVAPPSVHITGRRYAFDVDHHPSDMPLAPPPPWLLERLGGTAEIIRKPTPPKPPENWLRLTREPVTEYRDAACASFAGYLICHLDPVVAFDILGWWNSFVCQPPLDDAEVHRIWRRIVHRHAERARAEEEAARGWADA